MGWVTLVLDGYSNIRSRNIRIVRAELIRQYNRDKPAKLINRHPTLSP